MAKAVISSILESQLGKYVDGLSSDSLQVGLWSGELVLQNLSLKPHAFAELELPVTVVRGSIRRIHVVVPWNQLGSASVQVTIDGVCALVAPNTQRPTHAERTQAKANSIERHELVRQHNRFAAAHNDANTGTDTGTDESTFLSRLTERIVDNLHVTLRNVHVRYEDATSRPDTPFACGVVVARFAFHTTDAEGHAVFLDRTAKRERFVHKRVSLDGLGIYWDRIGLRNPASSWVHDARDMEQAMDALVAPDAHHAWLLTPCALAVDLTKNESLDFRAAAKFTVHAKLRDVALTLARSQYDDVLFVYAAFTSRRAVEVLMLRGRSRPFHRANESPRAWWDYAMWLVLAGKQRRSRVRWSTVQQAAAERRQYIVAFRQQLRKTGSRSSIPVDTATALGAAAQAFERVYPVDVVMAARDAAEDAEDADKRRRAAATAAQSKSKAVTTNSKTGGSWYGYFFGSGNTGTAAAVDKDKPLDDVLTAEGRADLQQAYDEVAATKQQQQLQTVPPGCTLVAVKLQLQNGSLALVTDDAIQPLVIVRADGSLSVNVQPADEWDARFRLERFDVLNGRVPVDSAFHTFCSLASAGKKTSALPCVSIDAKLRHDDRTGSSESITPHSSLLHVRVSAMPIRVLVDPMLVLAVSQFVTSDTHAQQQQLERVWTFATSSVSDWLFADDELDAPATRPQDRMMPSSLPASSLRYDVAVDMRAPVFVVPESVDDPLTSVVVVDLGQVAFHSVAPATAFGSDVSQATLSWRLEVANVQLLLGRLDTLDWSDATDMGGFAKLVQQLNVAFDVETFAPTRASALPTASKSTDGTLPQRVPTVAVRATIPQIAVALAEPQLIALARIHSSLLAQAAAASRSTTDASASTPQPVLIPQPVPTQQPASVPVSTSTPTTLTSTAPAPDKYYLQVQVILGEIVVTLREAAAQRDALQLRVTHMAFDGRVFASQYVASAKLQSLAMDDLLYAPTSRFRQLLSTGSTDNTDDSDAPLHLVAIDVTMYPPPTGATLLVPTDQREASFAVVDVSFNVLHVQWNPSSMALVYRVATAYVLALQHYSNDSIDSVDVDSVDDRATIDRVDSSSDDSTSVETPTPATTSSPPSQSSSPSLPTIRARASLVQLSVTFNKDDMDRQLVQLAIKDAALECTSFDINATSSAYKVTGRLGNFIATDLSIEAKHAVYTPLVGLDESVGSLSTSSSLLTFAYALDPSMSARSSLSLAFEPVRMVYYHQQVLELVDYLFEGILGALVSQTLLVTATQLLLSEADASVKLAVSFKRPTLVLPVQLADPNHVAITANLVELTHAPTSAAHFYKTTTAASVDRHKVVTPGEALAARVVRSSDCVSFQIDHKQVTLEGVNVFCVTAAAASKSRRKSTVLTTQSVVAEPVDLVVDVDDFVASDICIDDRDGSNDASPYLPRFTIRVALKALALRLRRCDYALLVALVVDNFGAEQLQVAAVSATTSVGDSSRPNVAYTYSRTDLDAATIELAFVMQTLQCVLYEPNEPNEPADDLDSVVQSAGSDRPGEHAANEIVARDVAMSLAFLRNAPPRVTVAVASFVVRALEFGGHSVDTTAVAAADAITSESRGVVLVCTEPTQATYIWDDTARTCELALELSSATGVVVPYTLLALVDFFTIAPPASAAGTSSRSQLEHRTSSTEFVTDDSAPRRPEYALTIRLSATQLALDVPQALDVAACPRLSLRANVSAAYTWVPAPPPRSSETTTNDLDIQSSVVLDARAIEVVVKNANRQGCRVSYDDGDHIDLATMVQVLEPCDVHVDISDLFPHAGQQQQIVAVQFTPIEVFVSYDDACIGRDTAAALSASLALYERKHQARPRPSGATDKRALRSSGSGSGVLSPRAFARRDSVGDASGDALEVHRYVTLEVRSMRLTVINDCDGCDMGLVQMHMQRLHAFLNVTAAAAPGLSTTTTTTTAPATVLSGGVGVVTSLSYYNPDTRTWHAMCRDWSLDVSLQGAIDSDASAPTASGNELHMIVTASQPLELLVTHGLLEVVASAGGAWNRRMASTSSSTSQGSVPASPVGTTTSDRKKHAPCVVRNDTGLSVRFWLANADSTTRTQPQTLASSAFADLHYVHRVGRGAGVVRTYASTDSSAKPMRLCLELVDAPFAPVCGIVFEQLGSRAVALVDAADNTPTQYRLNCAATLVDGRILLALSSPIKLVNSLSMPLQLLVNDPTWPSPVDIGVLDAGCASAVPVLLSLGSELRVRPLDDAFAWSAPIPIQTRAALEQTVEAAANGSATNVHSAIVCVALTLEQSLRVVQLSEPLVLVNKLPVAVTYCVKSPLLSARGSTLQQNTLSVGAAGGIWWTDSSQRPQFTLAVDGCKPSKWLELVGPNTKPGAVVAVALERLDGRPFRLLVQVVEETARALHVLLYAEVWVINRTGLELIFGNDADAEAYNPPLNARALVGNAQICAFASASDGLSAPVVRLRMASCNWSARFVADPRRLSWQDECLALKTERRGSRDGSSSGASTMLYELGVSADYATRHFGSITTLVSVIPRYLVLNRSTHTVLLLEASTGTTSTSGHGNAAHHILARGDAYALYWVTGARSKLHASVLGEHCDFGWSTTFSIDAVATADIAIPAVSRSTDESTNNVALQVTVKRGSISQATFVVVFTDAVAGTNSQANSPAASPSRTSIGIRTNTGIGTSSATSHTGGWDTFSLHTQIAGITVTVADRKLSDDSVDTGGPRSAEQRALRTQSRSGVHGLFGSSTGTTTSSTEDDAMNEPVARLTIARISVESNVSRAGTSAKMNVMGVKVEDLLADSRDPVVLRPVARSTGSTSSSSRYTGSTADKYFVELSYVARPHAKYTHVEKLRVELQDVKITTSMQFVDRLAALAKETVAHFERRSLSSPSTRLSTNSNATLSSHRDEHILEYFVTSDTDDDDASMASLTGQKLYVERCEIAPVRVVISFRRDQRDASARRRSSRSRASAQSFWLANLKLQIDNACLTLDAYTLSHALATQEALLGALVAFYVQSVKSQALGLIDSIQVTSLVTSMVTGGVSTIVSTLLGKTDPSLAASTLSQGPAFTYAFQSNSQILTKHAQLLSQSQSSTQFLDGVRHLVFDWDSNHTGLEARGCVALGLVNNSRHALVVTTRLNDGAELRVLPPGRRTLAGVTDSKGGTSTTGAWRADRAVVIFAYGYTPTLLTSGDVYFTVQSNACTVYVTRKTARLKANVGYTATFTHQEIQSWSATHVVIVGDDIQAHAPALTPPRPSTSRLSIADAGSRMGDTAFDLFGSSSTMAAPLLDEYEVVFTTAALGIIAKQSRRAVIVRELCTLPSGAAGPALACGQIAPGDTILAVSGVTVTSTTQFAQLVSQSSRPVVLRFRRTSEQVSAAHDLFGEAPLAASRTASGSRSRQPSTSADDSFDLFGRGQ